MAPKKGVAVKKKPDPSKKYIYLDSDGEEIDPLPATIDTGENAATGEAKPQRRGRKKRNKGRKGKENKGPTTPLKLSNPPEASGAAQEEQAAPQPSRQDSDTSDQPSLPDDSSSSSNVDEQPPVLDDSPPGAKTTLYIRKKPKFDPEAADDDDMAYIQPNQQRHMRACMVCSIVRTYNQFMQSGCPNCEHFLELIGNSEAVNDCTSQVFDGLMTVADTSKSWVARYQRLEGYTPGVYAVQVEGILPEDVIIAAENAGVHYVPRDGSASETLPVDQ